MSNTPFLSGYHDMPIILHGSRSVNRQKPESNLWRRENRNRNGNFSTGWLETGNDIDDLIIRKKFIKYILRHMDEEHYRKIVNSSVHEVFTIFEINE